MFSQLFFVLLALILINFNPESDLTFWVKNPIEAFQWGFLIYLLLLILLFFQSKFIGALFEKRLQSLWWPLINVEILLFLALHHFGLGAYRLFNENGLATYQAPLTLISLAFYFFALGWAYHWNAYFRLHYSFKKSFKIAYQQFLFYCPFCIPYLAMCLLLDSFEYFQIWQNEAFPFSHSWIAFLFGAGFVCLTVLFMPALMVICWRCNPLERTELRDRLERRCTSLKFRHAGLKVWSIMSHSLTAGIVGIIPAFRYILFTPALLNRFEPEEIEAILIHEIGHNRYRHLLFYPFILLGMVLLGTLLLIGIEFILSAFIDLPSIDISDFSSMLGIFILYAFFMGGYFRLIFGFYSRLFERQADLYIFESSLSPTFLIQAFDRLGIVTGNTHSQPSWHHFSLQERMHFLDQAIKNPNLIKLHHDRVKKWLYIYFGAILTICLLLYLMI